MMLKTKEKMLLSVEDQEEEKTVEEDDEEEEQEICNDDEEESIVGGEKEDEVVAQTTDDTIPSPAQSVEKKQQANVLILNNEVVKMRKEVKRIRALIIRKLARQIAVLKKKKGKETEIERNQRRAARLLKEVHSMKNLSPDLVTKTALQKSLNFEQVCKNPKSTLSDRAVARIATHPQFSKKIESIKAAVKAFKDERVKSGKLGGKTKVQKQPKKTTLPSPERKVETEKKENKEDSSVELQEIPECEKVEDVLKKNETSTVSNSLQEMSKSTNARPVSVKKRHSEDFRKLKSQSITLSVPAALKKGADDDKSDAELSDNEEREYFDDSTEERFRKDSSQSEESEEDDFFIGKVRKFKKKKTQKNIEGEKSVDKASNVKQDLKEDEKPSDKLQSELDELEARLKSKTTPLKSVFCSSLSGSKSGGGVGRGRGGGKFRGQRKPKCGIAPEQPFSNQPKFKNHEKETSEFKYSQACPERVGKGRASGERGRGRGRGRGGVRGQNDHRGGGVSSHQAPQPTLHPSWEASKKRKEQQGQILAFQGKKIKFDDDD